jgi:hypothetical protein
MWKAAQPLRLSAKKLEVLESFALHIGSLPGRARRRYKSFHILSASSVRRPAL